MTAAPLILLVTLLAQSAGNGAVAHLDFDRARLLYASASYEEALALLPADPAPSEADFVDQYRGLCLLALGRTDEAEQAFERLIGRNPLFVLDENDASPRVVVLVRDVRRRVLPARAEAIYASAKTDFERGKYREAVTGFEQATLFASDPNLLGISRLSDLRRLAEGFRQLAQARLGGPAAIPSASWSNADSGWGDEDTRELYTMLDEEVRPPVEIDRRLPPWNPPRDVAWRWFRGVVEVIVSETGTVEGARFLERIAPFYDAALLEAAKGWRFQPARLDGRPVRFRHRIELVLRSAQP